MFNPLILINLYEDVKSRLATKSKENGFYFKVIKLLEKSQEIYKELVLNNYDVGLATVYRVLTQFENARIVVKHQFESNKSVYELNDPLNHDHMVCVDTGETTEFYDEEIKNKLREIALKHGYELLDQSIILDVKKIKNKND